MKRTPYIDLTGGFPDVQYEYKYSLNPYDVPYKHDFMLEYDEHIAKRARKHPDEFYDRCEACFEDVLPVEPIPRIRLSNRGPLKRINDIPLCTLCASECHEMNRAHAELYLDIFVDTTLADLDCTNLIS